MYTKSFVRKKIDKLDKLYDLSNPLDLFTMLPQEMEIVEVRAMIENADGEEKKKAVLAIVEGIIDKNNIQIPKELMGVFIDTIISASKGKYALNKVKP